MTCQYLIDYEEGIITSIQTDEFGRMHKRFFDFGIQPSKLWEICNDLHLQIEIYEKITN